MFRSFSILCLYIFLIICITWSTAEKLPVEDEEQEVRKAVVDISSTTTTSPAVSNEFFSVEFLSALVAAFSVIIVSELGDKTFFIAAIMAMKYSRLLVFLGAISALALMTILSVVFGSVAVIIPKIYVHFASIALFLTFGIKMLWEGVQMSPNMAQEEMEIVQADLRKREAEIMKKGSSRNSVLPVCSPTKEGENDTTTIKNNNDDGVINEKSFEKSSINETSTTLTTVTEQNGHTPVKIQLEKEALTGDTEAGKVEKRNSNVRAFKLVWKIVLQAFTLTFIAEWGDRSQFTTIILAAKQNFYGVTTGGILGHALCTGLAVIGGRFIAQKISVRTVTIAGGVVFIIFALMTLIMDSKDEY